MTSSSESNLVIHFEEFALAQSVKRELMQLRARTTIRTSEDVVRLASKAVLIDSPCHSGMAAVYKVRAEACLAISRLSAAIEQNQSETNTSLLGARAIDLAQAWIRTAEPAYELTDNNPDRHRRPADPSPPTESPLSNNLSINTEADGTANGAADEAAMLRETLAAIPIGSAITFATEDIGFLLSTALDHKTEIELLARSCACSVSFHREVGTISFYRNENQTCLGHAMGIGRTLLGSGNGESEMQSSLVPDLPTGTVARRLDYSVK